MPDTSSILLLVLLLASICAGLYFCCFKLTKSSPSFEFIEDETAFELEEYGLGLDSTGSDQDQKEEEEEHLNRLEALLIDETYS